MTDVDHAKLIRDALEHAGECLTAAQDAAVDLERAEPDVSKLTEKVQRLGYLSDQWMKLAAVAAETDGEEREPALP
jgi:hypothetical protein